MVVIELVHTVICPELMLQLRLSNINTDFLAGLCLFVEAPDDGSFASIVFSAFHTESRAKCHV